LSYRYHPSVAHESWLARRLRSNSRRRIAVPRTAEARTAAMRAVANRASAVRRSAATAPHLIVCGDDPLAHRLVEELVNRYRVEVTVVLPSRRRNHGPQISRLPVRVIEAEHLDDDAFRQARVAGAVALALVKQDDVGNIHAALRAQEMNPDLRLVIRMFNISLGYGIRRLFGNCRVLSDASMAAPAFVAAALGEVAPVLVRLPGRTVYVARRDDVGAQDVLCPLAVPGPDGEPQLLPSEPEHAELVLAVASGARPGLRSSTGRAAVMGLRGGDGGPAGGGPDGADPAEASLVAVSNQTRVPRRRSRLRRWIEHQVRNPFGALRNLISRKLRFVALILFGLLVVATGVFAAVRHISWSNAAYETILITLGNADVDVHESAAEKITQMVLSVVSIALIPVVTAAVVEAVVNTRLALALGRLKSPISDHVVVVGLGNVGTRVIRQLHELGVPVVAIDKSETARGVQLAREIGVPLVIGDASRPETLRAASVETCRALVVVSTDDINNLEAALHGQSLQDGLRVVLRLFDGDFAGRVQKAFGITISRSVSYLAAPAFAAAMMEHEVIGTIPIGRRVLLIAEVPVAPGSTLDGAPVSAAAEAGQARVVALTPGRDSRTLWHVPSGHRLRAGDLLVVVATRGGLGRLLNRASAEPPPPVEGPPQAAEHREPAQ
jgi:Trk K+ transport system NAD-binding subunit